MKTFLIERTLARPASLKMPLPNSPVRNSPVSVISNPRIITVCLRLIILFSVFSVLFGETPSARAAGNVLHEKLSYTHINTFNSTLRSETLTGICYDNTTRKVTP